MGWQLPPPCPFLAKCLSNSTKTASEIVKHIMGVRTFAFLSSAVKYVARETCGVAVGRSVDSAARSTVRVAFCQ